MKMLDPNNILTPGELAARLKVPKTWIYEKSRARCQNPLPCMRIGRYIRFDWSAVAEWLATTQR
jgi:excisionase family DNA binding protein